MRWFLERGCGHDDQNGRVVDLAGYVTDITAARPALQELGNSERRFRAFFDSSPDAIGVIDPAGRLIEINQALLQLFGCHDRARVLACLPADLAPPLQPDGRSAREAAAAAIAQALAEGEDTFAWHHSRIDDGLMFSWACCVGPSLMFSIFFTAA